MVLNGFGYLGQNRMRRDKLNQVVLRGTFTQVIFFCVDTSIECTLYQYNGSEFRNQGWTVVVLLQRSSAHGIYGQSQDLTAVAL